MKVARGNNSLHPPFHMRLDKLVVGLDAIMQAYAPIKNMMVNILIEQKLKSYKQKRKTRLLYGSYN